MKFGVGQLVRVKDFGELASKYVVCDGGIVIGDYFFEREMKIYCGETFRVKSCFGNLYELYTEDDGMWVFAGETLELPNTPNELEVKVKELESENAKLKVEIEYLKNCKEEEKPKRQYTRKVKELE